ncbi:MAG: hypothetical protein EPO22_03640, partial [Dehalococcoidia bacterium]
MRAYLYRLTIICAVLAALGGIGAASLSVRGTAANNSAPQTNDGFVAKPAAGPNPKATARLTASTRTQGPLPPVLTDTSMRKSRGMTSDLDELYRIGLLARAGGQAVNRQTAQNLPPHLKAAADQHTLSIDDAGRVQVFAYTTDSAETVAAALAGVGMDIQRVSTEYGIVQGMIPIVDLERATTVAGVGTIAPPQRAQLSAGSQMTQGDSILNADLLRSTYGVDGGGVKVGVLSNGAEGMAASVASGDLPAVVVSTT